MLVVQLYQNVLVVLLVHTSLSKDRLAALHVPRVTLVLTRVVPPVNCVMLVTTLVAPVITNVRLV